MRSNLRQTLCRTLAGLALVGAAHLAATEAAVAACYTGSQELPADQVNAFLANPESLLRDNPNGGAAMISRVRDLVASNPATLPAIVGLLQNASEGQQAAIGTGAGQAARICVGTDQTFANLIQQQIAASGNQNAILAYTAITGDTQTAAAGGAGGGGGGGLGGPVSGFGGPGSVGGPFQQLGSWMTPNGPQGPLALGVTGGGGILPPGGTAAAAASP